MALEPLIGGPTAAFLVNARVGIIEVEKPLSVCIDRAGGIQKIAELRVRHRRAIDKKSREIHAMQRTFILRTVVRSHYERSAIDPHGRGDRAHLRAGKQQTPYRQVHKLEGILGEWTQFPGAYEKMNQA
jgi:hypothetical protein